MVVLFVIFCSDLGITRSVGDDIRLDSDKPHWKRQTFEAFNSIEKFYASPLTTNRLRCSVVCQCFGLKTTVSWLDSGTDRYREVRDAYRKIFRLISSRFELTTRSYDLQDKRLK